MVLSTLPMHCPPSWTVQIQALPPDLCLMPVAFCLFFFFVSFSGASHAHQIISNPLLGGGQWSSLPTLAPQLSLIQGPK